ncbi:unnamed protein product [Penicillium glandicola]
MGDPMPMVGRSLAIFVVSIVMMSISIVTVSLRSFVRLNILRAFGWDDALMVAALTSQAPRSIKERLCGGGSVKYSTYGPQQLLKYQLLLRFSGWPSKGLPG